jgi:hypothetical protein
MPVKNDGFAGQGADDSILGVSNFDPAPSDLQLLAAANRCPKRPGDQLCTEADPDRWKVVLYGGHDPFPLGREGRIDVLLVDIHRPTHEDGGVNLINRRQLVTLNWEALEKFETSAKHRAESMRTFPWDVADDKDAAPGGSV